MRTSAFEVSFVSIANAARKTGRPLQIENHQPDELDPSDGDLNRIRSDIRLPDKDGSKNGRCGSYLERLLRPTPLTAPTTTFKLRSVSKRALTAGLIHLLSLGAYAQDQVLEKPNTNESIALFE